MGEYYCHNCGAPIFGAPMTSNILGSTYQLNKFMKHTIPSTGYDLNSIFSDPSTTKYQNYIVSASCSGSYDLDDMGQTNILWVAGRQIGAQLDHGNFILPEDSIKIVLYSDLQRIHAYPVSCTGFSTGTCEVYGKPIVTS